MASPEPSQRCAAGAVLKGRAAAGAMAGCAFQGMPAAPFIGRADRLGDAVTWLTAAECFGEEVASR